MLSAINLCFGQYSKIDTTYYPNNQIYQIRLRLEGDSITIIKSFYSQYIEFKNKKFLLGPKKEDRIESITTHVNNGDNGLMQEGYSEFYFQNGEKELEIIYSRKSGNRYINQWDDKGNKNLNSGNGVYINREELDSCIYEIKDSLRNGLSHCLSKNKNGEYYLKKYENFEKNKIVGISKYFRENNTLFFTTEIVNDSDTILFKEYYENGHILESGMILSDKNIGFWKYFSNKGILEKIIEYRNGYEEGDYREFHSNGNLKVEGKYAIILEEQEVVQDNVETFKKSKEIKKVKTSIRDGKWIFYDQSGKIKKLKYYNNYKPE
jgi:antitoxin component YwqK of YwqJK toxin-antitoxin module